MTTQERILVIKLGALGDFIQALGPMAAIKKHHSNANITLLTTKPFESFANDCGYFDDIWLDEKPRHLNISGWLNLRNKLNQAEFTRIYDLQNNDRTSFYFKLLKRPKPEWVGVAKGASHRNTSAERTASHAFDGHVQTLELAGIKNLEIDELNWMKADISGLNIKQPYALLVPGSAPQHPYKRWPAELYGTLATKLINAGLQPVILGTLAEINATNKIQEICADAINLTGKTSLAQIVTLAKNAKITIGNDTGPMHLIGASGCPSLVLFSKHSNPVRHKPNGRKVETLQSDNLQNLKTETVWDKLGELGAL